MQPHRQRYLCNDREVLFDDLSDTALAGHHQPLRVRHYRCRRGRRIKRPQINLLA
jgi:hypothetical protein